MKEIQIAGKIIGPNERCYIIAEIGLNHNGDIELAKNLIDIAKKAGADAVKFQKRKISDLYQKSILNQPHLGEQGIQYLLPIICECELTDEEIKYLQKYCNDSNITFLCTPWDIPSVDLLTLLDVPAYKLGSPDLTNFPLIRYIASKGKPMLISTGMSTEEEILKSISLLNLLNVDYALFHCISTYPVISDETNLRFMQKLQEWTDNPIGFSSHDTGIISSLGAVSLGASLIEKHITLDRSMRGPDHKASLEPDMFCELVASIRELEQLMGVPVRWISRGEVLNRRALGKSLVAAEQIIEGTTITSEMIAVKSPGLGLSPQKIDSLIGKQAKRNLSTDDFFQECDIESEIDNNPDVDLNINIGLKWGIISRYSDINSLIEKFEKKGLSLIEFHISDRDLDLGVKGFQEKNYPYELIVHAPEYFYDHLIDLCSQDSVILANSIDRIQKTINLTHQLSGYFKTSLHKPKVIIHVGGMSQNEGYYDREKAIVTLISSLSKLDIGGIELLLENLPPCPWYYGGRWFGWIMTDADTIVNICNQTGLGLCFDTSHAALECNKNGDKIEDYTQKVLPFIRHIHFSDAAGISGEGLQIGEGQIDFTTIMPVLIQSGATCVPETWMGHHNNGAGFNLALDKLSFIVSTSKTVPFISNTLIRKRLEYFLIYSDGNIKTALQLIDKNENEIIFVVDKNGVLLGLATDGDIRRALLNNISLETKVEEIMNKSYRYATHTTDRGYYASFLTDSIRIIPIIDNYGRIVDYYSYKENL